MTTTVSNSIVTPEELLDLPDGVRYELVDGKLVERNMGMESSKIAAKIIGLLTMFLMSRRLGLLFGADGNYRCFPDDPTKLCKPDVSFVRFGRLLGDRAPRGFCTVPPDLTVEVLSPGDLAYEIDRNVAEYLNVGVPLVWVVNPETQTVRIHRPRSLPGGSVSELTGADTITGEDVLPGFSCAVKEFFA
jgi:Uma2 family endonuclease